MKSEGKKKVAFYWNMAMILVMVALVAAVVWLAVRAKKTEAKDYYRNKCFSYSIQNVNLAKGQIVFVGDSITDLYVLDDHYGSLQRACYNRGIGGDTTSGVLERLQVSIFDLQPSTVVLMIGTNDIDGGQALEDILDRYQQIVEKITKELPQTKLYCVSVIPQNKQLEEYTDLDVDLNTQKILELNPKIKQLAQKAGGVYIDLFPLLADEQNYLLQAYSDDGIHLNEKGLKVWTEQMLPLLQAEET